MTKEEWINSPGCELVAADLKKTLEGLCDAIFGPVEKRWRDDYFPFTEPSFELDIYYNGDWMEVCAAARPGSPRARWRLRSPSPEAARRPR